MSDSYIKLSKSGLSNAASRIQQAKEDYDQAIKVIESTVNSLDGVWDSKAQRSMKEKFDSMRSVFAQFSQEIESYASDMNAYRDGMEDLDARLASQISGSAY